MSFPRYPAYKDSGVEWIGEIPVGWEILPLKRAAKTPLSYGANASAENDNSDWPRFIRITDIDDAGLLREDTFRSLEPEEASEYLLDDGDILFARSGATVGKSFIYKDQYGPACYAGYLIRLKVNNKFLPKYIYYFSLSSVCKEQILSGQIQSTIQNFSAEKYANLIAPLPPFSEQQAIVSFLDRECGKIDALIAEQERLIALLAEKRQAIISHAVTKGLNPNAPMKDSGILWIGMVPERWEIRKLKSISRLETGHTPSRQHPEYWVKQECKIPWFTLADVGFLRDDRNIYINKTEQKISQIGLDNSAARILPSESVILSRTASVGFSGITTLPLAVSQDFSVWICGKSLWPRYLLLCLRSMRNEFRRLMMGSTHQTIYMPDIEAIRVPLPPLDEQIAITNHLFDTTNKMDASIAEITHSISLLKERRAALISAAVTGKIDVRAQSKAIAA